MCRSARPAAAARPSIYAAKRLCCGPGEERRDPTKQFYTELFVFNTVILGLTALLRNKQTLLIVDEVWKAMLGALGLLLLREASISEAAITRRSGEKGRIMRVPDAYRPRLGYRGSRLSAF